MEDRPVTLGYASPRITRASPRAFPAMTVVGPFAGGAMVAISGVVTWAHRASPSDPTGDLAAGFAVAWGQAAGLLIAVKAWTAVVRRLRPQLLGNRPWWMSALAGAGSMALWVAVVSYRSWAINSGAGVSDGFTYAAGICVEGAYLVGCAIGQTRRLPDG